MPVTLYLNLNPAVLTDADWLALAAEFQRDQRRHVAFAWGSNDQHRARVQKQRRALRRLRGGESSAD